MPVKFFDKKTEGIVERCLNAMNTTRQIGFILLFSGLLLMAPGLGRGAPDGETPPTEADAPVSDAGLFAQELFSAGALKFFENTEDILRVAQFERAFLRYGFLKGQIGRHCGYRPLVLMINQRLDFLKVQLRLPATEFAALTPPKARKMPRQKGQAVQAEPPAKAKPADAAGDGEKTQAEETSLSPGAAASYPQGTPVASLPPQASQSQQPSEGAQVQEEKPPEPPPPLSRWQRLKKRLLFWKK